MVFAIFRHAVKMIFSDFGTTLKISLPVIVMMVIQLALLAASGASAGSSGWSDIIIRILDLIASLWVAVAWHRYVLLTEYPDGVLPRFHGAEMAKYLGKTMLLLLIVIAPGAIVVLLGSRTGAIGGGSVTLALVLVLILTWVSMRLSVILPAAAVGKPLRLAEAWQATRPISVGLIGLLFLTCLVAIVPAIVIGVLLTMAPMLGVVFASILQWLMTLLSLSIATTLYGIYIEGRRLD